jgi:hypothetical protein
VANPCDESQPTQTQLFDQADACKTSVIYASYLLISTPEQAQQQEESMLGLVL